MKKLIGFAYFLFVCISVDARRRSITVSAEDIDNLIFKKESFATLVKEKKTCICR